MTPQTPDLSTELASRIRLVRRDMGSLLFHFTRGVNGESAHSILKKILRSGRLLGTDTWSNGTKCVCFTEAPIAEFTAIFSLVNIAATLDLRPRYEPYGIAVSKEWLFSRGGRPVIHGDVDEYNFCSEQHKHRFVPYNPSAGPDFTWEREWRVKAQELQLESDKTLIVVPTAAEAFDIMDLSVAPPSGEGTTASYDVQEQYRTPNWMAVSLDIFGIRLNNQFE